MRKNHIYPNSPLKEIIYELKFNGNLSIECKKDSFYKKIKNIFPKILVPKFEAGIAPALQPMKFTTENENCGVLLAINLFSFYSRDYSGFPRFKEDYAGVIKIFRETFDVGELNRIGLLYTNIIPYVDDTDKVPINKFFDINININENLPLDNYALDLALTKKMEVANLNLKLRSVINPQTKEKAIGLDLDYYKDKDLDISNAEKYLVESRDYIHDLFESLITKKYRQFLEGERV